ncbi:MAG: aldolase/citrate lyase family protein [Anaerococcus sp.]|uniref:Citrate lyase subunit beta n=1 Tax=Anaerococcus nagyae TaxID=1755241 RepID=A0A3E2TKJ5_9FIRM|nr:MULTISPECIES: aldolase/citrate lyase family protein [Anaerococcus]MBP2068931.1 citrate lyase subunit beta/citryl-CoA lyase [Anaerococcus nagyae]MDU2353036.1 aldolase/citrate lyase family protein [Anaerococcus sp.]MDU2566068.1 aldolase/citrate lyase family protein [Anaerococcus sp.]RGB77898.1 citrate lyase subunit beta [Anaerococcus nagyae]
MKREIRRTMMFLNAQRASLVKDPYIYGPDCVILDLEDAVSPNEKDSARIQLYNTLKYIDYGETEIWVRINATDSPYYKEDIRAAVAGGCDGIRIPMCESRDQVVEVEKLVEEAEKEFCKDIGITMLMAALETPLSIINCYEICTSSDRLMGVALSGGDFARTMHAKTTKTGEEYFLARSQMVLSARAAGVMCFDTVYTDLDDEESLRHDTELIKNMGFDGKSIISPKQIDTVHQVFTPNDNEISNAERVIVAVNEAKEAGIGVVVVNGKMVDNAHVEGAYRTLSMAKAAGIYEGDLI